MTENIYCGQCGAPNPISNKFCNNCGSGIVLLKQTLTEEMEDENSQKYLEPYYKEMDSKLLKLIEEPGELDVSYGDNFIQYTKQSKSYVITSNLGYANKIENEQLHKLIKLGYQNIEGVLAKRYVIKHQDKVIKNIIDDAKIVFETAFNLNVVKSFTYNWKGFSQNTPSTAKSRSTPKTAKGNKPNEKSLRNGFRLVLVIATIIILIIHFSKPSEDREAESNKREIESKFNAWNGSHILLVEHVKSKLRDPDSFEHEKTTYKDNGEKVYVVMSFRSKNGFGGYGHSIAYANCDKDTGEVLECEIIDQ